MTQDMWGTGDYKSVADKVASIGEVLVGRADIGPGMEVLDVARGAGNATIPAAKRGARVTGLDFSPGLLEIARQCGAAANVEVEWIEGDAQAMPFDDHSFDRVISAIGHMFAPDHRRTASELRRLRGPGGRIAIACWTPEGHIGEMFRRIGGISRLDDGRKLISRRPKASSRRCCGGPRITCASYLATIRNSSVTRSSGSNPRPRATRSSWRRAFLR